MLQHRQFSACINVDGVELEQYGTEYLPDENKVTCWVASEAGKQFSVKWQDSSSPRQHDTSGYVKVDGVSCFARIIPQKHKFRNWAEGSEFVVSSTSVRPIMFSNLQVTGVFVQSAVLKTCSADSPPDEDDYLGQSTSDLGQIELEIWAGVWNEVSKVDINYMQLAPTRKVHERAKKAGTHCVGFGEEVKSAPRAFSSFRRQSSLPLVTFIFKYRSYDLLKANGIIPAPIQNPAKRKAADTGDGDVKAEEELLTDEEGTDTEIQALKQKLASLEAKRRKKNPAKKIKREDPRPKFIPSGEVIDLT
ncbi:hypothetical protein BV22DRAFT_1005153 [Leucogyrophana mollusca]|uniref:Uncharacterized protein n=1 Tax=Leucogyrophana mollusca TaxID=85980 RepID=A0ACB8BT16_9AGAM|nr:hypothetical protein BV22DRAFT_1005153 [Leucogyrophana mollusca]